MLQLEIVDPALPEARRVMRAYLAEVAERYYGHTVTEAELDNVELLEPSAGLVAPTGFLMLARRNGEAVGCGGVRLVDSETGELTKIFSVPSARGTGVGRAVVVELERVARERGIRVLRLDTRTDLVEARGLYASLGYAEVEAYNTDEYAQHWFAKAL